MKKNIIATIVCTLILFGWQAISWMATPIHKDTLKYTPKQEAVHASLSGNLDENGLYGIPTHDPSKESTMEEKQAAYEGMLHKPWALVLYNTSFEGMNAANMIYGLLTNLVAIALTIGLLRLARAEERTFGTVFAMVMVMPLVCIFQPVVENAIWWSFPWHFLKGTVLDLLVGWGLCAWFLAWRFGKRKAAVTPGN